MGEILTVGCFRELLLIESRWDRCRVLTRTTTRVCEGQRQHPRKGFAPNKEGRLSALPKSSRSVFRSASACPSLIFSPTACSHSCSRPSLHSIPESTNLVSHDCYLSLCCSDTDLAGPPHFFQGYDGCTQPRLEVVADAAEQGWWVIGSNRAITRCVLYIV